VGIFFAIALSFYAFFEIPTWTGDTKTADLETGSYQLVNKARDGKNILLVIKKSDGNYFSAKLVNNGDIEEVSNEKKLLVVSETKNSRTTTIYSPIYSPMQKNKL